jgi:hypothetical protein
MNDLHAVRESFVKTLRTSLHRRIPYPDEKPEEGKGRTRTGREAEKPATSLSGTAPPPTNVIPMPVTPPVAAPPAQEPGEKAV